MPRPINPNYGMKEGLYLVDPSSPRVGKIKKVYEEYNKLLERDFKKQNLVNTSSFKAWAEKKYGKAFVKSIDDFVYNLRLNGFDPEKDAGLVKPNLSETKTKLLEELVTEANKKQRPVPAVEVLRKVFKAPTLAVQSDLTKNIVSKLDTLQNKVDKAFEEIIDADEILVKKTKGSRSLKEASPIIQRIAQKIGFTTAPPIRKAIENNPFYAENNKLIRFARDAALFDGERPFSKILEEAKYRVDGGVHWSQKSISKNPSEDIYQFALRHWNNNKRNKQPSKIEFYDKKTNKPIIWNEVPAKPGKGKSLNRNDVYFKFSEDPKNQKWTYDKVKQEGRKSGLFDEIYESKKAYNDLLNKSVTNPKTGKKQNFGSLMRETLNEGYGYSSKTNPYGIDHVTGVSNDPFSNLRVVSYRDNLALDWINRKIPQANFRNILTSELMSKTKNLKGLEYINQLEKGGLKLAEDVLTKGKTYSQTPIQELAENIVRNPKMLENLTGPQLNKLKANLNPNALEYMKRKAPKAAAILLPVTLISGIADEIVGSGQAMASTQDQTDLLEKGNIDYGDPETWNMKVGQFIEEAPILSGTIAAATPLLTKPGQAAYKKIGTQALKILPTPLTAAGFYAGFGFDPESGLDRATLAAEAALSKELVRGSQRFARQIPASSPMLRRATQGILNLGMPARLATGVARFATPLGLASLGLEGGYQFYQALEDEKARIAAMSPEERQAFEEEQTAAAYMGEAENFAYGGRVGMKIGGDPKDKKKTPFDKPTLPINPNAPQDPGRRTFMEGVGLGGLGIAGLLSGAIKFAPEIKKAVTGVTSQIDQVPNIVNELYFTIKNFGKQIDYPKPGSDTVKYEFGPYKMEEGPGGYNITKMTDSDYRYQQEYFEVYRDPETGVIEYEELTVRPDLDGKLKDVDYGVELDTYREIGEDLAKIRGDDSLIKVADDDIIKQIEKEEAYKKSLQKKGTGEND